MTDTPSDAPGNWRAVRPMDLEPYYCHWVSKLTSDDLHDKGDIATVLALLHRELDDVRADYLRVHKEKCDLLFARPEGNALTEQEFAKIEAELIGPGRAYGFVHVTYCHVCGNNVEYGHMDDCPWAKAKALLSPLAPSKKESP